MFEFVVEFDRKGDQRVRQQGRQWETPIHAAMINRRPRLRRFTGLLTVCPGSRNPSQALKSGPKKYTQCGSFHKATLAASIYI
jgi:hypothetical protein